MSKYYTSEGIIRLDYEGRVIEVPFSVSLYGYGGLPLLSINDKHKHRHSFVRGNNVGWHPNGREPKWSKDFLALLYDAFEIEYIKLKGMSNVQERKECTCPYCEEKRKNTKPANGENGGGLTT